MLLRWMVSHLLREVAERKVREAVTGAVREGAVPRAADEASADEPAPPCEIAVQFALGIESGGLVDRLRDADSTRCPSFVEHVGNLGSCRVVIADSGVGAEAARRAAADLISLHHPRWMISAGFAGALHQDLRRGHVLMADALADTHGRQLSLGLKMDEATIQATPDLHVGRLLTVDRIVRTPKERRKLAEQYDAVACDMETMAVADECRRQKIRCLSVRIVSDALDDRLPAEIERLMDQQTVAAKMGAVAGAIFNRPSSVKDLWKLKQDAVQTSDALAKFLLGVVRQLAAPDPNVA